MLILTAGAGVHLIDGRPDTRFVKVDFSIASSDAERIGVNSAAEVASGQAGENSALARHYAGLHGSLAMLKERLELLVQALQRMQDGAAPVNHQVCFNACCDTLQCSTSSAHAAWQARARNRHLADHRLHECLRRLTTSAFC